MSTSDPYEAWELKHKNHTLKHLITVDKKEAERLLKECNECPFCKEVFPEAEG